MPVGVLALSPLPYITAAGDSLWVFLLNSWQTYLEQQQLHSYCRAGVLELLLE